MLPSEDLAAVMGKASDCLYCIDRTVPNWESLSSSVIQNSVLNGAGVIQSLAAKEASMGGADSL